MKKRLFAVLLAAAMTLGALTSAVSAASVKVFVDNRELSADQPPVIIDGRTLVPLRAIFEALGAEVDWDGDTKTVTSTKGSDTVKMTIGDDKFTKNGETRTLDVPAQIINSRTMVPVRAISEAYGCTVDWDNDTKTVSIYSAGGNNNKPANPDYSVYDTKINEYRNALAMSVEEFYSKYDGGADCSSINALIVDYCHGYSGKNIGYTLYDVDNNGVSELIFSDLNSVIDIYTLKDNKIVKLYKDCFFGDRTGLYILPDGKLFTVASVGSSAECEIGVIGNDGGSVVNNEKYYYNYAEGRLAEYPEKQEQGYTLISSED